MWQFATKRWGCDPRCWVLYSGIVGVAIGAFVTWRLTLPWFEFESLTATYRLEAHEIQLTGHYHVHRACDDGGAAVWENKAVATDGQIALYGPVPAPPDLTKGEHDLAMTIPLLEQIYPDGWAVTSTVACSGEHPETVVSHAARVLIMNEQETPP